MAIVGAVKLLAACGASSLLRVSGAPKRTASSMLCTIGSSSGRGRRAFPIICADCPAKQWSFLRGLGFMLYAAQKSTSVGDTKSAAHGKARRGAAPHSALATVVARKGGAAAALKEGQTTEEEEEEWKSRNQCKREAKRGRQWGMELASLAPAQLKQAVRWAGLPQEVYDAVMIVKNLGTSSRVRNGRRRQYNYIGGLLRDLDPNVMEPVLKATRDGDVESIIVNSPVLPDPEDLDDKESWAEEDEEGEDDSAQLVAEEWLHGLINGIASLEEEVYSIYDVDYDRQELRKLVRNAQKLTVPRSSGTSELPEEDVLNSPTTTLSAEETKSQEKLRQFLFKIAKERAENQALLL